MKKWNDINLKHLYEQIKDRAIFDGYSEKDLQTHYVDNLCKQTKSYRIIKMIKHAYYLGWLRGIAYVDSTTGSFDKSMIELDNSLEYRGYSAKILFSSGGQKLYGSLQPVKQLISFEAENVEGIIDAFRSAVDEYISTCYDKSNVGNE